MKINCPEEFKQKFLNFVSEEIEITEGKTKINFNIINALENDYMAIKNMLSVRANQKFTSEDIIKAYKDKTIFEKLYKTAQHNLIANELLTEWYVICWNSYFGSYESKKR